MQTAETVLDVIRKRGEQRLPITRLYRQLFNPQMFLLAYQRIYANRGAMTPGVTGETVDGMSQAKIDAIIGALRAERYRWKPVKRVHIPKKNGERRPLGLPTWSDKLVAEVVRLLLDAYYEPQFSAHSHGFRPGRGCHTALSEVTNVWKGTHWFIEGDISDCFGSIDHQVLLSIIGEHINDGRFLRLIEHMLKAGYVEDWRWHATFSGTPQGGVASPILSNIYLDKLDQFVEQTILPKYNRGNQRRRNPAYTAVANSIRRAQRSGDRETVQALRLQLRTLPSLDPNDPEYRRLRYVRYADDWLLGFAGPKCEAEAIKSEIRAFLSAELHLELSEAKTLVTHAASQAARFLGYDIRTQHNDTKITDGRRSVNGTIGLFVPRQVVRQRSARYMRLGKPTHRGGLVHDDDFTVVAKYGAEYRGLVQYYLLAQDVSQLDKVRWVMQRSMLKTLAAKHHTSVTRMARRYSTTVETDAGPRRCLQVTVERRGKKPLVARFGGIPLAHKRTTVLNDHSPILVGSNQRNELIRRLLADRCEVCDATTRLQVHHVRALKDLNRPGRREKPAWIRLMAARQRKTLVVCAQCHQDIHAGRSIMPKDR